MQILTQSAVPFVPFVLMLVAFALTGCQAAPFSEQMMRSVEDYASLALFPAQGLGTRFAAFDLFGVKNEGQSVYYVYGWYFVSEIDRDLEIVSAVSGPAKFIIKQ